MSNLIGIPQVPGTTDNHEDVIKKVTSYRQLHSEGEGGKEKDRKLNYTEVVTSYYDLVTDFYEKGWGQCFHFAKQFKWEKYSEAIRRHEYYLSSRLGLKEGMNCLDIGCGVGGPMRNIASFSGAKITGLNLNKYQVKRGNELNKKAGLSNLLNVENGDFMKMPYQDESFDASYEIEATAHAPSKVDCYKEVFRVLKPGAIFAGYEWVLTQNYDPNNAEHQWCKKGIEEGNGLPDIAHIDEIGKALREAGFEDIEVKDVAPESDIPWQEPLTPRYTWSNWQVTSFGKWAITKALGALETVRIVPKGTVDVEKFLFIAQTALCRSGELKCFTPMCLHIARKPLNSKNNNNNNNKNK